jgi:hypothetical protein
MSKLFDDHSIHLPILAPFFQPRLAQLTSDRSRYWPRHRVSDLPVHLIWMRQCRQTEGSYCRSTHRHDVIVERIEDK